MAIDLILGTAGHIDHGKTSLIRALTGVDTDRLPEEKRRGITIDLGFAELRVGDYRLGIVDVPGHERFVRNMLAGATGMDLALLVVAADDSVKPQTVEHLEIMRLLELPAGVIALTKCDLVDADWLELVAEEVRELVADTFLEQAPIVPVSSTTGEGIDRLKAELERAARRSAEVRDNRLHAPFRMAIDRVFTVPGHGTVVTGSVSAGQARLGDQLVIEPGGISVRIRGIQNHDRTVEEIHRGQRAAINLAGVHHEQIHRGHELALPGHLRPARIMTAELRLGAEVEHPLKSRSLVRLHLGAAEYLARVRLLNQPSVAPGESALVQFFLERPAVAVWKQPFVLRSESPVVTIGGGHILDPEAEPVRRAAASDVARIADLASDDPLRRSSAALFCAGLRGWEPRDLYRSAGIESPEQFAAALKESGELVEIRVSPVRTLRLHREVLERVARRVESALEHLHDTQPLATFLDPQPLASGFSYLGEKAIFDAAVQLLVQQGRVRQAGSRIGLASRTPQLSQGEWKLLESLVGWIRDAGLEAPTLAQLRERALHNQQSIPQLLRLACERGDLVQVADDFYLHADTDRRLRAMLEQRLSATGGMTMADIRDLLGTTRKFAVPYCEFLDRTGFTRRQGDLRVLAQAVSASTPSSNQEPLEDPLEDPR